MNDVMAPFAAIIAAVLALAVLTGAVSLGMAVSAVRSARGGDTGTAEGRLRGILWIACAVGALPGLAWFLLWSSGGFARSLLGLAGAAVALLPVLAAYRLRRALPAVLAACLLGTVVLLLLGNKLFLLLPFTVAVTACWAIALGLTLWLRTRP